MKVYKKIYFVVSLIMIAQMLSLNVYAYIDVSATTYIIQIVAGVVVAVGAVAGVVISKIKKKAKEKFNIDLEKKETEEDIVVYDENSSSDTDE
ncbi:MAG: hypothetical protein ACI4KD_02845 [Oscillospiraceae bacterium]